ncbi:lysozyme inhibitor LprI family protein [Undibacterium sp. TJN19]|uniref:lysozyme inhibitor LprI family protein n=1 Tax=Undibacterium sp. TJN19 TaxID=3413055 RepID=UPI003BF2C9C2
MKLLRSIALPLACTLTLNLPAHAEILCQASKTTVEEQQCMIAELAKADKKLVTYLQTARAQLAKTSDSKLNLDEAQKAWEQYRTTHCADVYTYWAEGSIRYRQSAQCQIDLSQQRTHDIWKAYLSFADSTPPVLAEP